MSNQKEQFSTYRPFENFLKQNFKEKILESQKKKNPGKVFIDKEKIQKEDVSKII